jgi:hypothetical protein
MTLTEHVVATTPTYILTVTPIIVSHNAHLLLCDGLDLALTAYDIPPGLEPESRAGVMDIACSHSRSGCIRLQDDVLCWHISDSLSLIAYHCRSRSALNARGLMHSIPCVAGSSVSRLLLCDGLDLTLVSPDIPLGHERRARDIPC